MVNLPVRCPSTDKMVKQFKMTLLEAQQIKKACAHGNVKSALSIANKAMGGYGIESLHPQFPGFYYVNMGDTYDNTLYYNGTSMQIGSWGDWYERHGKH